jgi:pentatricopeptide repeat protein
MLCCVCSCVTSSARAEAVLHAMRSPRFGSLTPNVVTHTAYIKGLCSDDDPKSVHKAYACLQQLTAAAAAPPSPASNSYYKPQPRKQQQEEGAEEGEEEAGQAANIRTYNTLLRGCLRCGEVDLAQRLFQQLTAADSAKPAAAATASAAAGAGAVQPDVSSYEYVIKVLALHNRLSAAWAVADALEAYAQRLVLQYNQTLHASDPNFRPHNTHLQSKMYVWVWVVTCASAESSSAHSFVCVMCCVVL